MKKNIIIATRQTALIFATIGIFVALFSQVLASPLIFLSFASSIFAIFALPNTHTSETKVVLGSQLLAAFVGYGLTFIFPEFSPLVAALSVGIASFFMIVLNMRHAPAAGTALAFSYNLGGLGSAELFLTSLVMVFALGVVSGLWHLIRKVWVDIEHGLDELEDLLGIHKKK
ncbi:MAG: HPP family protein [archaeon]